MIDTYEIRALLALALLAGLLVYGLWQNWREARERALDLSMLRTGYGRSWFKLETHRRFK